MKKRILLAICMMFMAGCAGLQRSCASTWSSNVGANWIIVQFGFDGRPFNCWKLTNVVLTNEQSGDGVWWQDADGHLAHVAGWYNRVQVKGANFDTAARMLGVEAGQCGSGRYPHTEPIR
jgi:hypothetical protein